MTNPANGLLAQSASANVASLTDNSSGTASDTIAAIGATYDQDEMRNAIASLTAKVNALLAGREATGTMKSS